MKRLAILLSISLAGCGERAQDKPAPQPLDWHKLPDGSQYARKYWQDIDMQSAYRCWPTQSEANQSCISVTDINRGEILEVSLVDRTRDSSDPSLDTGGYNCTAAYNSLQSEKIARGGNTLVSNSDAATQPWSADYVNSFMDENQVEGARHFRCLDILRLVKSGSLETLSTTAITRDMIDR